MSIAALSIMTVGGWMLLAQVGEKPPQKDQIPPAESKPAEAENSGEHAKTRAGNFKVEALGVADVGGKTMTVEFDISRLDVKPQFHDFGESKSGGFQNGAGGGFAAGAVSGGGGGAAGGFGGSFTKPNLGIALKVESIKPDAGHFVKLGSKVKAIDDLGNELESKNLGPTINHFVEFEKLFPDAQFLYIYQKARDASKLVRLEGELLVTPGRKLTVTFDSTKKQTKGGFKLESVASDNAGVKATITFPQTKGSREGRTPQERLQAMVSNRGAYSVTLEDSAGEIHQFQSGTSGGGGATTSFTFNGSSVQGAVKSPDASTQTFGFPPLPEGRTIKAIHATLEDRTGEARVVPFTLENIPLK